MQMFTAHPVCARISADYLQHCISTITALFGHVVLGLRNGNDPPLQPQLKII